MTDKSPTDTFDLTKQPAKLGEKDISMIVEDSDGQNRLAFMGVYTSTMYGDGGRRITVRYSEDPFHSESREKLEQEDLFEVDEDSDGNQILFWYPHISIITSPDYYIGEQVYDGIHAALKAKNRIKVGTLSPDYEYTRGSMDRNLMSNLFMIASVIARGDLSLMEEIASRIDDFKQVVEFDFDGLANRIKLTAEQQYQEYIISE